MVLKSKYLLLALISCLLLESCAKKGRPSGGPKDEEAPLFVIANPAYETTNFDSDEIKIEFNEYITLKDLTKQLVVSPPLKNNPIITPQGSPSKFISIKILDTLQENSTYIFDFGKSVQDNNEGNQLEKFKYVFSTGNYIDSLEISGSVKDAFDEKASKNIKLLLYRADSTYRDSLIYNTKPNYVSSTLDTTLFKFSNLAPGKFFLFALEDKNSDYFFDPKVDKIGVYPRKITIPEDSVLLKPIELFKENLPYQFKRSKEDKKGKIIIAYQGKPNNLRVSPISKVPSDFRSISKFEREKDTLNYWFHNYDKDSIILLIETEKFLDTAIVRLRKKQLDTIKFSRTKNGFLEFNDTLLFKSNNPIIGMDTSKILLTDKDTTRIKFKDFISSNENKFGVLFEKSYDQKYKLRLFPDAIKDLYGFANKDTIDFNFSTRKLEDYGDVSLTIVNPKDKNLIVELLNDRNTFIGSKKINSTGKIVFSHVPPQKVKVRIIHDLNNNGIWDTGNFLQQKKPESLYYFPVVFELRANWSWIETITINDNL